jgi:hypothetical protein
VPDVLADAQGAESSAALAAAARTAAAFDGMRAMITISPCWTVLRPFGCYW